MPAAAATDEFTAACPARPSTSISTAASRFVSRLIAPTRPGTNGPSTFAIALLALFWIGVVGLADYWTGPEYSMLIFYLVPVTLGTWFVGRDFGMLLALSSIVTSSAADLASGLPDVRYWNELVGLTSYAVFVHVLSRWRQLLRQLDDRVRQRTAELQEEILERTRLETEINNLTERERRRLGHDLHDSVCQHLTGTALSAQTLLEKLEAERNSHAPEAGKVVELVEQAIDLTRTLARGLFSSDVTESSLASALDDLARNTAGRGGVECEFHHDGQIAINLSAAQSTQLYRIATEAVTNACKHAHPSRIIIELDAERDHVTLNVYDDGIGFDPGRSATGLGLRMMQHGARLIGASFDVRRNQNGGSLVTCSIASPEQTP